MLKDYRGKAGVFMITLIAHWEDGWLDNKTEHFMWKQLCHAYSVDRLVFVGNPDNSRIRSECFNTVEDAIKSSKGKLFILNPNAKKTKFRKVKDSVFLFGNAVVSNEDIKGDHIRIETESTADMFAINAAAIILDRIV